jgi:hypothetical protein
MKTLIKIIMLICIFASLSGCARLITLAREMPEPSDGNVAMVRIDGNGGSLDVGATPGSDCADIDNIKSGIILNQENLILSSGYKNRSLNMPHPEYAKGEVKGEFYVPANKPITFYSFVPFNGSWTVGATKIYFVPKKGHYYQLEAFMDYYGFNYMNVYEITDSGLKPYPFFKTKTCPPKGHYRW